MGERKSGMWGIPGLQEPKVTEQYTAGQFNWTQQEVAAGVFECAMQFTNEKGAGENGNGSAILDFVIDSWSVENQIMLPGSVYGGNRFQARRIPYPPIFKDEEDLRADLPITVTNIARLNIGQGESRLERDTRDLSTPAIGLYMPDSGVGCWLLLEANTAGSSVGIVIEENEDRSTAVLSLRIPTTGASQLLAHKGQSEPSGKTTVQLHAHVFPCTSVSEWIGRFAPIRKSLADQHQLPSVIPFFAAWDVLENKYNEMNWHAQENYYSVGLRENHFQDWQCGWVGGGITTYPLLAAGSGKSRERARQTIDFMFRTQAESGLLHGIYSQGQYPGDGFDREDASRWHLIRKSGDVLYFVLKQIALIEQQGESIPDAWKAGVKRLADAFVRLWKQNGQFGQFIDVHTGDIIVGGSTSGAILPAGLMLAAEYFNDERYAAVARESARLYVERDLKAGYTTGGPGEILQCPDSESAFALLESLIVLYEMTGEKEWLTSAREAANLCMTWCVSYDFQWPSHAEFGRLGMKTTGTVLANAQNQHSAPGICTLSGNSLLKLFRATGDMLWLELLRDIARTIPQYMSRNDRPIMSWDEPGSHLPAGFVNERVNLSAWEGEDKVGGVFNGSCWSETALMLTIVEVPGLYVQPDTGIFAAIDHIGAERLDGVNEGELRLRLWNETSFPAAVHVLSETSLEARKPLGQQHVRWLPALELAPGASIVVQFGVEGFQVV
ncbi:hypothetical protein [Paenibacillus radicis (ex Gao et al. 2016)]|uniref:Uncharacterized protein n=1 Tax=Paenibacillus radicis (ex Gao et al. 2016) TaxID=1737354 RepID=A0A917HPZ0_9BACL|nr:hypothetical protein [Paenibacillus radicis (ex Gao et al. 2016)]GGG85666.1 hypothetical protein GCM10010918_49600 [Paenibacillus radicis (ex Gao et al. 2016)]